MEKITDYLVEITNKINSYFVNVGPHTEKGVPKVPNITPDRFLKNRYNFIIAHISYEEVLKIIKSLPNESTGSASIRGGEQGTKPGTYA